MTRFETATGSAAGREVDLLVLPVFEGPEAGPGVRDVRGADLVAIASDGGMKGTLGETFLVPNVGIAGLAARSVLLVGAGPRADASPANVRRALGRAARRFGEGRSVATTFAQAAGRAPAAEALQAAVEGVLLGGYRFDRYRSSTATTPAAGRGRTKGRRSATTRDAVVTMLHAPRLVRRDAEAAVTRAEVIAEATNWARDLVNTPALDCPPERLAEEAQAMAKEVGLTCKVWREEELRRGGFGGILGVGAGSSRPPRMIELSYAGGRGAPIALTGKGIAFDTGGLSLKDPKNMETMKDDMAGAASIMATMKAIARLKLKINVIAAIPTSENMPSGTAIRPGDVLTHRGGRTTEVLNTDAEGRLVLADTLAYLTEKKPRCIIDTATLTGAIVVALGDEIWAAMGNDPDLVREVLDAGERAGESGWEMPLWKGYRPWMDSSVADLKNISGRPAGGAITAGLFLQEFVGEVPWVHMDIAGPAFLERDTDTGPRGATGVPVRTLVEFVSARTRSRR